MANQPSPHLSPAAGVPKETIDLIAAKRISLPPRLRQLADEILRDPSLIAESSVASSAKQLRAAPSAMVRLAQALGFKGYSDLQMALQARQDPYAASYSERLRSLHYPEKEITTAEHFYKAFSAANINSLEESKSTLDFAKIEELAAAISKARTIMLAGQKRALPLVEYLNYGLVQLERNARIADPENNETFVDLGNLSKSDCLMVVSFYPYAAPVIKLIDYARNLNVRVFSITDDESGPISTVSDLSIIVKEGAISNIRGITLTATIIQTIFATISVKNIT